MQTPAIHALRENFPNAEIIGFTPARAREALANNPDIDRLVSFHEQEDTRGLIRQALFAWDVRRRHIDAVFLFHRSFTRALLFYMAGVPERIGYTTKGRNFLLTSPIEEPKQSCHQTRYFLRLLERAGLSLDSREMFARFYPSAEDRAHASGLLDEFGIRDHPFMVMHPGANWAPKRWDARHLASLADHCGKTYGVRVILTGGSADHGLAADVVRLARMTPPVLAVGRTTLGQLGALFERACLVVSGDSGPMHAAAGVGAPLLALFLATDFRLTGPCGAGPMMIVQKIGALRGEADEPEYPGEVRKVTEVDSSTVIRVLEESGLLNLSSRAGQL